jgi:protein-disulfide isomerase
VCLMTPFRVRRFDRVDRAVAVTGRGALTGAAGLILAMACALSPAAAQPSASSPLAEVNGDPITATELERALGAKLSALEEQIYDLKRQELDNLIAQRLLAQEATRRGISVTALVDAEITSKVSLVTEQEVDAFYQANKARLRGDEASIRDSIRAHLQQQKLLVRRLRFLESVRSQSKVVVRLQPPPVVRLPVSIEGAPVRGAVDAPVTLVEFSDFHCPFCRQVQTTLKAILDRYPGKVKPAFRDFPVDGLHPQTRKAAEAARCAHDQGKFWSYHDTLFANAPNGTPADLRRYANDVGLDVPAFEHCLSAGTHRESVQRDYDEGARLGVAGTPAFFVNGRLISGAQPLEAFTKVIDQELARP